MCAMAAAGSDDFIHTHNYEDDFLEDTSDGEDDGAQNISFEPAERLNDIHWHRRCIGDIVEHMNSPYMDLNPDYQRDVVWPPDRMTKLIDSLMTNYYVPPVIFNVVEVTDADGLKHFKRISIDGKQRLTSIREFVNGAIPCTDSQKRRWYFCEDPNNSGGKNRRILPQKTRREFLRKELLIAEFSNLERRQEEDLFSRVQLGMPLTPAEKLKASSGKWQDFAITIEKEYQELIMGVVDNRRARGFQLILQIFKQLLKADELDPTYSAGATALKGFCADPKFLDDDLKKAARSVFDRYTEVYQKYPDTFEDHNYKHAKKFSPVEFVGVAVLIHRFPDRNARLLAQDILVLRKEIREHRQDLRSNMQTWKTMIETIVYIESSRGGVDPSVLQPKVNRHFGSAEDGETGIGEILCFQGHISTQDATGQSPPRPARTTRVTRKPNPASTPKTTATTAGGSSTKTRAAPVSTPARPTPTLTSPTKASPNIKRESSLVVNGHRKPATSLSALPQRMQTPLSKDSTTSSNNWFEDENDSPQPSRTPAPSQPPQRQNIAPPPPPPPPPPPQVVRRANPADGPPPYNNFYGNRSDFGSRFKAVATQPRANGSESNAAPPARKRTRDDQTEQEKGINIKRERLGPFSID